MPAPKLELRQSQSLVMTQQLQQSIRLLQLSSLELSAYIEEALEQNPLLVKEDEQEPTDAPTPAEDDVEPASLAEKNEDGAPEEEWSDQEEPYAPVAAEESFTPITSRGGVDDDYNFLEQGVAETKSLRDWLRDQLHVDIEHPAQRMIGLHLIDLVDEAGYIKADFAALAEQLGCEVPDIEETLALLQRFDPPGVCARDLAECLTIQLKDKDHYDPAMATLLGHLDLLGKGDFKQLQKLCGVDDEDFAEMRAEIKALNPRPGLNFASEATQTVVPDIFLRKRGNGWQVELNPETLTRLLVNQRYHSHLSKDARDEQARKYLTDQMTHANWLIKSLEQRAQTMLKVSTEIVAQQDGFLRWGIKFMRPLTLREVADAVELHESTVSRVTANKYIMTPRGMFELKYFFTSSLGNTTGGEDYSSKSVQAMIGEMIDAEKADAILSDDDIAAALKAKGVGVARRTVAKYREALSIPSSVQRRRQKT